MAQDFRADLSQGGCDRHANLWQVHCRDCGEVPDMIHSYQDQVSRVVGHYCPTCCPNCGDVPRPTVIQ